MSNNDQPVMGKKQLIRSFIIAMLIGGFVLVSAVLPAEYNMDPLGTGKLFGFSKLYVSNSEKVVEQPVLKFNKITINQLGSPENIEKPIETNNPPPENQYSEREDVVKVTIPAGKGIEYKVKMLKYGSVKYDWITDSGVVYLDFHGEVKQENPPKEVFYESYTLANSNNMAGTFTAPFEGKHGWYFKNKNIEDIVITIKLNGQYQLFK
jgi:hypothetical protein